VDRSRTCVGKQVETNTTKEAKKEGSGRATSLTTDKTMKQPLKPTRAVYAEIRHSDPGPIGSHWQSVGTYLGEDVWGDPEYVHCPGEYEFFYHEMKNKKRRWPDDERRNLFNVSWEIAYNEPGQARQDSGPNDQTRIDKRTSRLVAPGTIMPEVNDTDGHAPTGSTTALWSTTRWATSLSP
jgi:hypothetical protein